MNERSDNTTRIDYGVHAKPLYEREEYVVKTKLGALLIHLKLKQVDFARYCKLPIGRLSTYINKDVCPSASTWLKIKRAIKSSINYDLTDDVIDESVTLEEYVKSLKLFVVTELDDFIAQEQSGEWKIDDGKREPTLHLIVSPDKPKRKSLIATKEVNQGKYRMNRKKGEEKDAVRLLEGYKVQEHYTNIDNKEIITPIEALRKVLNVSKTIMAHELKISVKMIDMIEDGLFIMNVPLAKAMQEFARKRGFPVTLDELYQNIIPYAGVENEERQESDH